MAPGGVRTRECSLYFHEGLSTPSWEWLHPRNGGGVVLRLATRGCCWRVYDSHSGLKAPGLLCAGNRVFFFFFCQGKLVHCTWWFSVPCFRPAAKLCGGMFIKCVFWWVGGPASGILISQLTAP